MFPVVACIKFAFDITAFFGSCFSNKKVFVFGAGAGVDRSRMLPMAPQSIFRIAGAILLMVSIGVEAHKSICLLQMLLILYSLPSEVSFSSLHSYQSRKGRVGSMEWQDAGKCNPVIPYI